MKPIHIPLSGDRSLKPYRAHHHLLVARGNGTASKQDADFWSWFAGFWEGEGSAIIRLYATERKGRYGVRLSVSQANRKPLDYIVRATGLGTVFFRQPKRTKKVWWNDRGTYIWQLDKVRDVITVASKLLPFLRFRQGQLAKMLKMAHRMDASATWRSWTAAEIKHLRGHFHSAEKIELCSVLNRNWISIQQKAQKIGLRRHT